MDEFDELDYQGRSKQRVENDYKVAYYSHIILLLTIAALLLYIIIFK
jgi:hypothetical protein